MRRMRVLVVLAVCSTAAAVVAQDAAQEQKKLQGTWSVVLVAKGGKKPPEGELSEMRVVIAGDKLAVKKGDKDQNVTFTLDPSKKPKQIDITSKDRVLLGIYELKGDALKICAGAPGEERPTEFASPEGSKLLLLELKREKK